MPAGFQLEVSKFFILFLTLSLTSIAETALIFAISTPLTIAVVANIIGTLAFVIQLVSSDKYSVSETVHHSTSCPPYVLHAVAGWFPDLSELPPSVSKVAEVSEHIPLLYRG